MQLFLLVPILAKLFTFNKRVAWVVVLFITLTSLALRMAITLEYHLGVCIDINTKDEDLAEGFTTLYDKPFVLKPLLLLSYQSRNII
jgi:hypothetical protein